MTAFRKAIRMSSGQDGARNGTSERHCDLPVFGDSVEKLVVKTVVVFWNFVR